MGREKEGYAARNTLPCLGIAVMVLREREGRQHPLVFGCCPICIRRTKLPRRLLPGRPADVAGQE